MTEQAGESINDPTDLLNTATDAVKQALIAAFHTHETLAEHGLEMVQENQFGDSALRADVEAENAVLKIAASLNCRIFSEEHGVVDFNTESDMPILTGVLDGIDGTSLYKSERGKGNYGTLFALYEGDDPAYSDYLATGIMQHSTGRLILATKGQGLTVMDVRNGELSSAHAKDDEHTEIADMTVYVDNPPGANDQPLRDYFSLNETSFSLPIQEAGGHISWLGASAAYYAAVAIGEADAVGESTRKGNLEIIAAYGLIKEAGGVMVTLDGEDIGINKIKEFGQSEHIPILTAANQATANRILGLLDHN